MFAQLAFKADNGAEQKRHDQPDQAINDHWTQVQIHTFIFNGSRAAVDSISHAGRGAAATVDGWSAFAAGKMVQQDQRPAILCAPTHPAGMGGPSDRS
jgi:hypothetical protein